jgi:hypothetical protein
MPAAVVAAIITATAQTANTVMANKAANNTDTSSTPTKPSNKAQVGSALVNAGSSIANAYLANRAATNASKAQTDAVTNAAKLQKQSSDQALQAQAEQDTYNRYQTWAQQQARLPYVNASNQSLAALAQGLHLPTPNLPTYQPGPAPAPVQVPGMRQTQPYGPGMSLAGYMQGPQPNEPTVLLEAPNGQRKAIPQSQAAYFIAKGAKQVSQ